MAIYTKTGDKGETGLIGGKRIPKDSQRIEAIGCVDELNAALGILLLYAEKPPLKELLTRIQKELFSLGAELAHPGAGTQVAGQPSRRITTAHVHGLESAIDEAEATLPRLTNFILPNGTPFGARAHFARAVCRRAERQVIKLHNHDPVNLDTLAYLNRLSDLLFVLARADLFDKQVPEIPWKEN